MKENNNIENELQAARRKLAQQQEDIRILGIDFDRLVAANADLQETVEAQQERLTQVEGENWWLKQTHGNDALSDSSIDGLSKARITRLFLKYCGDDLKQFLENEKAQWKQKIAEKECENYLIEEDKKELRDFGLGQQDEIEELRKEKDERDTRYANQMNKWKEHFSKLAKTPHYQWKPEKRKSCPSPMQLPKRPDFKRGKSFNALSPIIAPRRRPKPTEDFSQQTEIEERPIPKDNNWPNIGLIILFLLSFSLNLIFIVRKWKKKKYGQ